MKKFTKLCLIAALLFSVGTSAVAVSSATTTEPVTAAAATNILLGTPTGYKKASDVKYVKNGSYIANWGARDEDCTFLSTYAQSFYTGSYVYETLSQKKGGSTQSNAPSSDLYKSLQTLMTSKHSKTTSYGETKELYRYTDCVNGNSSYISSFYSGTKLNGSWGSGWNREHTWPNSKGLDGQDENDIMMLRPTYEKENSSRGNTAYGQSSTGYYDPNGEGQNLRGDCARICLYVYVRWGNTGKMWGQSGVMENLTILLQWMEEDPVDTWEMGRNDAVQAITGTRNVFIDYPEYAWLLFGKSVPKNMSTPSSNVENNGNTGDVDSSNNSDSSSTIDSSSSSVVDSSSAIDSSVTNDGSSCEHVFGKWFTVEKPTSESEGYRQRFCENCPAYEIETLPKLTDSSLTDDNSSENSNGGDSDENGGTGFAFAANCQSSISFTWTGGALLAALFVGLKKRKHDE